MNIPRSTVAILYEVLFSSKSFRPIIVTKTYHFPLQCYLNVNTEYVYAYIQYIRHGKAFGCYYD